MHTQTDTKSVLGTLQIAFRSQGASIEDSKVKATQHLQAALEVYKTKYDNTDDADYSRQRALAAVSAWAKSKP